MPPVTVPGGTTTVRYAGRLRHLGIGRAHNRTPVILLIAGQETIVTTRTGELLAEHTINPDKDYQRSLTGVATVGAHFGQSPRDGGRSLAARGRE